jgi:hypothetical protein
LAAEEACVVSAGVDEQSANLVQFGAPVISLRPRKRRAFLSKRCGLLLALCIAGAGTRSQAETATAATIAALSYQPPKACPSRVELISQLALRGVQVDEEAADDAGESPIRLAVDLDFPRRRQRTTWSGTLVIRKAGQAPLSRTVRGANCSSVASSLALVAGIALAQVAGPPLQTEDETEAEPAIESEPAVLAEARAQLPPPAQQHLGLAGRALSGIGGGAPGAALVFESAWQRGRGSLGGVATASVLVPSRIERAQGSADFRAFLLRFDACWSRRLGSSALVLAPCAGLEGGAIHARGDITLGATAVRPWIAPGLSLRGAWHLPDDFRFVIVGSAFAPLVRDRFVFDQPRVTLFRTPPWCASVEMGLSWRFQ